MTKLVPEDWIDEVWKVRSESVFELQSLGLNWLFTINTGGLAGGLAFAATKEVGHSLIAALIAFSLGVICMLFYAGTMLRWQRRHFEAFRADVRQFRDEKIKFPEVVQRERARPDFNKFAFCLSMAAGILATVGIVLTSIAIL
jgi:uncharacterized membrane protein